MEGMSRTAWRADASLRRKVVRKMGGAEGAEGSAMYGWLDLEVWSLYQVGGMECLGDGGWSVFEEAILIVKVYVELTIKVYWLHRVERVRKIMAHTLQEKFGA
jgi:hypothetical protein